MAFIAGYATKKEIEELTKRGWEVESAYDYGLIGEGRIMEAPRESPEELRAVVVFVDSSVFEIMDGPDWEKNHVED